MIRENYVIVIKNRSASYIGRVQKEKKKKKKKVSLKNVRISKAQIRLCRCAVW